MESLRTSLSRLRLIGRWEGVSFLLLLAVAMPLKYFAGWPTGVRVVGMAHGILFLLYVWATIQAAVEHEWRWRRIGIVLAASLLPAGLFLIEQKYLRDDGTAR